MRSPLRLPRGLALLVALALLLLQACAEPAHQAQPAAQAPRAPVATHDFGPGPGGPITGIRTGIGFQNAERLAEHYRKHGAEFGAISKTEYLRGAQQLRDAAAGGPILEIRRADGVITRYDRGTGTFVAFEADGTIRTCFRPNDGEAYFQRQARGRRHR